VQHVPNINPSNPGKMIDYTSIPPETLAGPEHAPMRLFGSTLKKSFNGTLFRFPLRQQAGGRLSNQIHTIDSINNLLDDFKSQAASMLLFLKCVESIQFYTTRWEGDKLGEPTLQTTTQVSVTRGLREKRKYVASRENKDEERSEFVVASSLSDNFRTPRREPQAFLNCNRSEQLLCTRRFASRGSLRDFVVASSFRSSSCRSARCYRSYS